MACVLTLTGAGASAAPASDADSSLGLLTRVAAAAQSGDPDAVQHRYDAARGVEDHLKGLTATTACRSLYDALARVARANVVAAEGFDRRNSAIRARAERERAAGRVAYDHARPACRSGFIATQPPSAAGAILEPLEGEAFFGQVRVIVPAGTRLVELRWRGHVVFRKAYPRAGLLTHELPDEGTAGRGTLTASIHPNAGGAPTAIAAHVWLLPASAGQATTAERRDSALTARLATIAAGFGGIAGIYVHDMASGRTAAWNDGARFPAASTVKLGVLAAALDRYGPRPERDPRIYDMVALAAWSSNLAANRLLRLLGSGSIDQGGRVVESTLRRLGATRSTYPGAYRVGTAHSASPIEPPLFSQRTTTARDLGHILTTLQAAAADDVHALRTAHLTGHEARVGLALLLDSQPSGDNVGLFRPWLPAGTPVAQKHGWISSARHTAAIVYTRSSPIVVVLTTYRANLSLTQAQRFGKEVFRAALSKG